MERVLTCRHRKYYWVMVLAVFAPLVRRDVEDGSEPATAAVKQAHIARREAALEIAQLCRTHQALYGSHAHVVTVQPVFLALLALLDESDGTSSYQSEISDLCVFFRAISRRSPWAMSVFRMFQLIAKKQGKTLPPHTEKLFEDFEKHEWAERDEKRINSLFAVPEEQHLEAQNMGEFFEMLERLNVDDHSPQT